MKRIIWWLIAIAGVCVFGLIIWNATRAPQSQPATMTPPAPRSEPPPPPAMPAEPEIRYPVPDRPPEKPLPALDTSDSTLKNALTEMPGGNSLIEVLVLKDFVRRVVATVDNLPAKRIVWRVMPMERTPGTFEVKGNNQQATIAAENAARYARYVKLAEAVDSAALAALYFHFYPLFQQAYRDLGYPKGHFNDRLIEVIDHLLAAPELKAPVALVRPKVFYLYADPELEARSAGQKILMRMGAENAVRIKAKLREFRARAVDRAAPPAGLK